MLSRTEEYFLVSFMKYQNEETLFLKIKNQGNILIASVCRLSYLYRDPRVYHHHKACDKN